MESNKEVRDDSTVKAPYLKLYPALVTNRPKGLINKSGKQMSNAVNNKESTFNQVDFSNLWLTIDDNYVTPDVNNLENTSATIHHTSINEIEKEYVESTIVPLQKRLSTNNIRIMRGES